MKFGRFSADLATLFLHTHPANLGAHVTLGVSKNFMGASTSLLFYFSTFSISFMF